MDGYRCSDNAIGHVSVYKHVPGSAPSAASAVSSSQVGGQR
jgi:hypothetical protein